MKIFGLIWHTLAHAMVVLACCACGSEDANEPSLALEREHDAGTTTKRSTDAGGQHESLATTIRVHNTSDGIRSRSDSSGGFKVGVRSLGAEVIQTAPTCAPVDCADVPAGETVEPVTECSGPAIQPARRDVRPDSWDEDYVWDGTYKELTQRNCYDPVPLKLGDSLVARACYGEPGDTEWDVINWACTDYPFEYGQATLVLELD